MVPNLEARIMNGSSEETKIVADLVGYLSIAHESLMNTRLAIVTERCRVCKVRRHEKLERRSD